MYWTESYSRKHLGPLLRHGTVWYRAVQDKLPALGPGAPVSREHWCISLKQGQHLLEAARHCQYLLCGDEGGGTDKKGALVMLTCQGHCPTLPSLPEAMPDEIAGSLQADKEENGMGDPIPEWCPSAHTASCSFPKLSSSWAQIPFPWSTQACCPWLGVPYFDFKRLVPPHLCLGREEGEYGIHPR